MRQLVLLALWTLVAGSLLAQESAEDRLARLKATPRYDELRARLMLFRLLPPERQEAIRQLDRDLQNVAAGTRSYLEQALERYADWLERLPPADRDRVITAPDRRTRLQRIRAIRERQWLVRLPKTTRELVDQTDVKTRNDLIRKLRQEERDRHADWTLILRHWDMPIRNPQDFALRLDALPVETRDFVERELRPLLSREDEQRLLAAQGQWPRFPRVLVELADQHPLSILGPIGPTRIAELPAPAQELLTKERVPGVKTWKDKLQEAEGKWPEFGVIARDLSDQLKIRQPLVPHRYLPAEPRAFSAPVQEFIQHQLYTCLDDEERSLLRATEGVWPAYPRLVLELSRRHHLQVPRRKSLPGPADYWNRYRLRPTLSASAAP